MRIEGATQGSGVLVVRDGSTYTVLTAWHVVSGQRPGEELDVYTSDGKQHQLEQGSIQRLGQVDMAVLTFRSPTTYEVASVGDVKNIKYDNPIYIAGFPFGSPQKLQIRPGKVVANAEVGIDQGYQLLYDNKTESGMSGGALLNSNGQLVGLHGRGERDDQSSSNRLIIKTGVNQGVPITFYSLFASGVPVVASKTTATTEGDYLAQAHASIGKSGREKTVIRLSSRALSLRPSFDGYMLRGLAKLFAGQFRGALEDCNNAIQINPRNVLSYSCSGTANDELGNLQTAISLYSKANELNKSNGLEFREELHSPLLAARGHAKRRLGDVKGAITDYSTAISHTSEPSLLQEIYHNRAVAKRILEDYQGAISDFSNALTINSRLAMLYNGRAYTKADLKDFEGAIADYNKAISIEPLNSEYYANRANSKFELNDYQGALRDLDMAIELDGNTPTNAYTTRGAIRSKHGDYQEAIADFSMSINLNPQDPAGYANRGRAKELAGDLNGACADWREAYNMGLKIVNDWIREACH